MSNRPRHRADPLAAIRDGLTRAGTEAPSAVIFGSGRGDGFELQPVRSGKVLHMVSVPPSGASEEMLLAYSARATASVTGQCPECGARQHLYKGPHDEVTHAQFAHEDTCSASDESILRLLAAWSAKKAPAGGPAAEARRRINERNAQRGDDAS